MLEIFGRWRHRVASSILILLGLQTFELQASLPERERSLESCRASIEALTGQHYRGFSSSLLIPLGKLLAVRQLEYIAKLHVLGDISHREHPTPGLAQMFLTASSAADALIAHLDDVVVRPEYTPGDIVQGAVETLSLMLDQQPKYIRDAVLIRDGVMMVIPLLERVEKGKFPNKKPLYRPIIVKGHQELEESDVLAAAFASWALAGSSNLGRLPDTAKIYLKPMAKKRDVKLSEDSAPAYESFEIFVRDHLPEVERLHERYVDLISDPEKLSELPLRRNSAAMQSSWFPYLRELMKEEGNLTMMPYPPREEELEALTEAGVSKVEELAQVSVRSEKFFELVLATGIQPERLRYFISHALAIEKNQPVRVASYEDPFAGFDWLVHVDFEDFMERDVTSGVYLFGVELEDTRSRSRNRVNSKDFIFAPMSENPSKTITQKEVDEGWAQFLRWFPKKFGADPSNEKFALTVYSHHERTKFNQQFDIVEADEEDFSPQQRASKYYQSYETTEGKVKGRLIRNQTFFRQYKDLDPNLVFLLLDRMIDLLPYIRWNFSFPTHTNSLKYILDYIMPSTGQVLRYPDGWNGLESIEWAKKAYQTGEPGLFERIRIYNEFDIDSNYFIADFIRRQRNSSMSQSLQWKEGSLEILDDVGRVADSIRRTQDIARKAEAFAKIFRKRLTELSDEEYIDLLDILDRSEYLAKRKGIRDSEDLDKNEKDQALQREKYEFSHQQKHRLIRFFEKVGGYDRNHADDQTLDHIADLFLNFRLHEFTPTSLDRMYAYEVVEKQSSRLRIGPSRGQRDSMKLPNTWIAKLASLEAELEGLEIYLAAGELESLLQGVYFTRLYQQP